jgi:translation initiation factor 1 (eIF-1/SUI1)
LKQTFPECKQEEEMNREDEEIGISVRRRRRGRRMRMIEKY